MKPLLFLTRLLPEPAIKLLEDNFTLKINPYNRSLTKQEIMENIKDADALICLLTDIIDKEIIDAAPKLKVISNYAVGYNNIDVEYAIKCGIVVCNTPARTHARFRCRSVPARSYSPTPNRCNCCP